VPGWFLRHLLRKVARVQKDVIVCTGDYVSGANVPDRVDGVWALLDGLHAPQGVYSVLGNCDHVAHAARSLERLEQSGQGLRGRPVELRRGGDSLWLAGAGDLLKDHLPLDGILAPIPPEHARIVLAHNPDTADTAFTSRVDLFVTGHTHGGQLGLPWLRAKVLPVRNKAYTHGLKTSPKGTAVFISKGVGWGVFPGRLACLPEIPILELVPGPKRPPRGVAEGPTLGECLEARS
jgi:predicted MPP superfamily phosphohydrolase